MEPPTPHDAPQLTLYDCKTEMPSRLHHDYNPAWDYEIGAAPRGEQAAELKLAMDAASDLLKALDFPGAVVFLSKKGGLGQDTVGKYVHGTCEFPVIGLDLPLIRMVCRKIGLDSVVQVKATLAHELAHAWLQARCEDEDLIENEEEVVERFAYEWVVYGEVCLGILTKALPTSETCQI